MGVGLEVSSGEVPRPAKASNLVFIIHYLMRGLEKKNGVLNVTSIQNTLPQFNQVGVVFDYGYLPLCKLCASYLIEFPKPWRFIVITLIISIHCQPETKFLCLHLEGLGNHGFKEVTKI